jgi:hypothetical protein
MHSKYKMLNTILGSPLPPVVCRRAHVLFTLCFFAHSGVQHILCCVFVFLRLLYHMLPVFPNYPFLIAPSGFSNNYDVRNIISFIYMIWFWFLVFLVFQQYFDYIMATSFSCGGSWSTRREPPTMGKQLANFITCGCESSAPFFSLALSTATTLSLSMAVWGFFVLL